MNTLASGWRAVSYGHATFSVYNFVSADADHQVNSTNPVEDPIAEHESAVKASPAPPLDLSQAMLACS